MVAHIWRLPSLAVSTRIAQGDTVQHSYSYLIVKSNNSMFCINDSGVHTACPENEYCWAATTCNVHEFWPPPTPRPTGNPTLEFKPSATPTGAPSIEPTGLPTRSPLAADDPANFMYCGIDWVSCCRYFATN